MKRLYFFLIFIFPLCQVIGQNTVDMRLLGKWCVEDASYGNTPYCFEITMNRYGKLCAKVPASMENHQVISWQNTAAGSYIDSSDSNVNHYYFESVNSSQMVCYGINYLHPSGTYEYRAIRIIIWMNKIEEDRLSVYVSYFYGPMEDRKKELGDLVFKKVGIVDSPQLIDNKQTRKKGDAGKIAEAIDLGLSVKWASWNVGASKPEEYGGYYAWGEIEEKDKYDWSSYKYCDGNKESCYPIGTDIGGTEYDIAHVKWGDGWRMPTRDEINELWSKCTKRWTDINGVEGLIFIGSNGNSIFLPAAGIYIGEVVENDMTHWMWRESNCWTSNNDSDFPWSSFILISDNHNGAFCNVSERCRGNSVRPVTK